MKVSKRRLKRIIREEKRKLIKEQNSGIYSMEIPRVLGDFEYSLPDEIDGALNQIDRNWRDSPEIIQAVHDMLDRIKGNFQ